MSKKYVIAMDQGTTSSRAAVFNKNGEIVSMVQKEFRQIFPKPGQNNFLQDKFSLRLHFTDWTVTVVVKTYNNNSEWKYMVDCPTAPCPH